MFSIFTITFIAILIKYFLLALQPGIEELEWLDLDLKMIYFKVIFLQ